MILNQTFIYYIYVYMLIKHSLFEFVILLLNNDIFNTYT